MMSAYGSSKLPSGYNWRSNLVGGNNYTSFDDGLASRTQFSSLRSSYDDPRMSMEVDTNMLAPRSDSRVNLIQQELVYIKQDSQAMKNAILILEKDRDNLRQAIRKLKVENSRQKTKSKKMCEVMRAGGLKSDDMETDVLDMEEVDFDNIKEFVLIGGNDDPLSLRHEVAIRDENGLEHKSAERFLWFKMAETFKDMDAGEKIRTAPTGSKAEEEMAKIKDFNEAEWNVVKMKFWEEGQRIKFDQVRHLQSLLVYTGDKYLAIGSQDKIWGTGWRKQRQESWRPKMWDGENLGGKTLMKLRAELKANHAWMGPHEEQETQKKYQELLKTVWDKNSNVPSPKKDQNGGGRMRGMNRGMSRGSRGGMRGRRT